jgi:hypothetical protein
LPPGSSSDNRITVRAHRQCNSNASADEEYLRDLLIPEAIQFGYQEAGWQYKKVWRAWSKPGGWKRYQEFLATARPLILETASGLYVGRALGISLDIERVNSVGTKIARGIIFHDTQAFVDPNEIVLAALPSIDVPAIKKRDSAEGYWRALDHPTCKHTMVADGVALRRFYQGHGTEGGVVVIETHLAIMIWNLFFAASIILPLERIKSKKFSFMIETGTGEWVFDGKAQL